MRTEGVRYASITCGVLLLALLVAPAGQADERVFRINECNSDITITQAPGTATVGTPATVTLTVFSTDARDNMDGPIAQEFDKATYVGDCQTPPGIPCTAMSPARVMYQGNLGGTCNGMGGTVVTPNPMGDSVVEFNFAPALTLLVTSDGMAPPTITPDSCTITFEVVYAEEDTFASQATTTGICLNTGFPPGSVNSDTTVTTVLPAVPTMGEVALALLALILLAGAWLVLRRNRVAAV